MTLILLTVKFSDIYEQMIKLTSVYVCVKMKYGPKHRPCSLSHGLILGNELFLTKSMKIQIKFCGD